jgi:inosine-uridine nucleoside N-ribohydrolase
MAGAWQARGNQSPAAEYNIAIDPESARIVFDCFENVIVLPWEVSLDQGMPWERLHRIADKSSPRARFLKAMTPLTTRWQMKYKFSGVPLPDPMAVMLALDATVATSDVRCRVRVDIGHDVGRALTALDRRHPQLNARVVTAIDETRAWGMLEAAWSL